MDSLNEEIERLTDIQKRVTERLEILKKEAAKQEEAKEEKPEVKVFIVGAEGAEDVAEAIKTFVGFMKGIADDND